jgi:hypothetical protein
MYYRSGTNRIGLATNEVTYSTNLYGNPFRLLDSELIVPVVDGADPWAGQRIGIEFVSNVSPGLIGGVWDLDNVRLTEFEILLSDPKPLTDQFQFTIYSAAGSVLDVLRTTDPSTSLASWQSLGLVTNSTGVLVFTDTAPEPGKAYYGATLVP